jgi:hypothetical protein
MIAIRSLHVGEVVARQQDRRALRAEFAQELPRGRPRLDVHPGRRLVEDRHGGPADEGKGERQPLPLPAGQAAEPRLRRRLRQADRPKQLVRVTRRSMEAGVESDHLPRGHPRLDPAAALEHQPDPRPVVAAGGRRVGTEHGDGPVIGPPVALDDLDRRRLAGAVRPEQGEDLARGDPEGEVADDGPAVICLGQPGDLDRRPHPVDDGAHPPPEIIASCRSKSASVR